MRIALIGASSAGKTTVSKHLVESFGFVHVSTGTIVRTVSSILFGDDNKKHLAIVAKSIKSIADDTIFKAAVRNIDLTSKRIVFDAVRNNYEYTELKLLGFTFVKVSSSLNANHFDVVNDEFEAFHETANHDFLIRNDSSFKSLFREIDNILSSNIK